MEEKRLDAAKDNWDRMVKIADDRKAVADKIRTAAINKKKKRVILEKQQKKK